jgi:hypothetical protein
VRSPVTLGERPRSARGPVDVVGVAVLESLAVGKAKNGALPAMAVAA